MKRIILLLLLIIITGQLSCNNGDKSKTRVTSDKPIKNPVVKVDTTLILSERYIGIQKTDNLLRILNSKGDTILRIPDVYQDFEFDDFNEDGLNDIITHFVGNVPIEELYLFDIKTKNFKNVKDFSWYNEPKSIRGTKYFYSYHRSGCADMNWDSDLFFIDDFKAICIGNIFGRQCEGDTTGIFISKVKGANKELIEKFSVDIIENYSDYKWGFIKEYWTKNYDRFKTE